MGSMALRMGLAASLCAIVLSLGAGGAVAGTTRIEQDTTWTAAEGPHTLDGNVLVMPDATLTIEPGARIEGAPGAALIVRGVLLARGTPDQPITFTSATDERWQGIRLVGTESPHTQDTRSEIRDARVSGAVAALSATYDSPRIARVTFEGNRSALLLSLPAADVAVTSSQFIRNGSAIAGRTTLPTITITGSDFWANRRTLLAGHKRAYDCGSDRGVWRLTGNDLLRGPDQPWHSGDLFALPGSGNSNVTIDARDNHWGTARKDSVAGRLRERGEPYWGESAADASRKPIVFEPLSLAANTAYQPPGPAGSPPDQPSLHRDPLTWQTIERPQQGRCYQSANLAAITGEAGDAMGTLTDVRVAVMRHSAQGCLWLVDGDGTLRRRRCSNPAWQEPDGLHDWRLPLDTPLAPGRYVALVRTNGGGGNGLGVERIQFTVAPNR